MHHVIAQGVDERMINVHYYYDPPPHYYYYVVTLFDVTLKVLYVR